MKRKDKVVVNAGPTVDDLQLEIRQLKQDHEHYVRSLGQTHNEQLRERDFQIKMIKERMVEADNERDWVIKKAVAEKTKALETKFKESELDRIDADARFEEMEKRLDAALVREKAAAEVTMKLADGVIGALKNIKIPDVHVHNAGE